MSLKTPRWWYAQPGAHRPLAHTFLKPLALVWAMATANRLKKANPVDPGAPVICIGNLTVGGTGKTPVAREIVSRLRRAKIDTQLLSRGYGGQLKGPVRVVETEHTAGDVGDEPLMLARDFPVWVSRDRPAGALAAVAEGAKAIVMDDGHQNPSLKKALSFVVVDGETRDGEWPFGDGSVVPAGPMREPLAKGLARADAVILLLPAEMKDADPKLLALFVAKPVLIARLVAAAAPPKGPVMAFAGVGKPWKVERGLKDAGVDLVEFVPFPDHGTYDEKTLQELSMRARSARATLVTTEKDWVRLPSEWRKRITAWPIRAKFEDEAKLDAMLKSAVGG